MDGRLTDEGLRTAFRSAAPAVDWQTFCEHTQTRLDERTRRRGWTRTLRVAGIACGAAVLLAGLSFGVLHAVSYFQKDAPVIVISDLPTTEPATAPPSSTTSTTEASIDSQGLWAGNVHTVPDRPASLPDLFYKEPTEPAELVMGEPLWVFANELSVESAAQAISAAPKEQSIVVFGASEELCELLDVEKPARPSSIGELPAMFTQNPILARDKVFTEVGPYWSLSWVTLGVGGVKAPPYDPMAVYQAAVAVTADLEATRERIEANKQAQADGDAQQDTTATTDPYPIPQTVDSKEAEALVEDARVFLCDLTGKDLSVEGAQEGQMLGPNEVIEHRGHEGQIIEEVTGKRVRLSVFWSAQDQLAHPEALNASGLEVWFDAGPGARGVLVARMGYQCIIQLADGMTANVSTGGPLRSGIGPTQEVSLLSAEQMIAFTKWLVERAGYLHP
jgi:hypothetical protein